jgi:hypothetical protein
MNKTPTIYVSKASSLAKDATALKQVIMSGYDVVL